MTKSHCAPPTGAAGTVRLEPGTTKNDEGRVFPFAALPALADLLRRQREWTAAVERATGQIIPWVFHRDGAPIKDFRGAWERACKAAGVPGRLFHDFRRTAVRNFERRRVPCSRRTAYRAIARACADKVISIPGF